MIKFVEDTCFPYGLIAALLTNLMDTSRASAGAKIVFK